MYRDYFLKDIKQDKKHIKVMSCFSSGGGSSIGYKLAGFDVISCVEIDPKMYNQYLDNFDVRYPFNMDIRDFNKTPNSELPKELFNLDILDGSPPCTLFSNVNMKKLEHRGVARKFKEGVREQTLDDLLLEFCKTINKLSPKIAIIENVVGLLDKNSKEYVDQIYLELEDKYIVNHVVLNSKDSGVAQSRNRVFFICVHREKNKEVVTVDLFGSVLDLFFLEQNGSKAKIKDILDGDAHREVCRSEVIIKYKDDIFAYNKKKFNLSHIYKKRENRGSFFSMSFFHEDTIANTLTANCGHLLFLIQNKEITYFSKKELTRLQSFPMDYSFYSNTRNHVGYTIGMSVPPFLIRDIALSVYHEFLSST